MSISEHEGARMVALHTGEGLTPARIARAMGGKHTEAQVRHYLTKGEVYTPSNQGAQPSRKGDGWTQERVEKAKSLWTGGYSASQISKIIGGGLTRNAVIGKIHRLGLSGRGQPTAPAKARKPRAPKVNRHKNNVNPAGHNGRAPSKRPPRETVPPVPAVATARHIPILDLDKHECRFPTKEEDGEHLFCGAKCKPGDSYCEAHARIAFNPGARKRRETASGISAERAYLDRMNRQRRTFG